jgi:hypothetical protein
MLREMIGAPARYVIAFHRKDLIEEKATWLRLQCAELPEIVVITVHSDQRARGTVMRRVEDALREQAQAQHAFIFITHETLLSLDPSLLQGWQVGIDENPETSVVSGEFLASATWRTLAHQYKLDAVGDGRSWLVLPRDGVEPLKSSEIINDAAGELTAFHKRVLSGHGVFVNIGDWEDARTCPVQWWSVWTPYELLRECQSVVITGANFFNSLAYHATQWLHDGAITFEEVNIGQRVQRTGRPKVTIFFYTRHEGTTVWWRTQEGSRCLVQISRWLEQIGFDGYWSCNDEIRPYFCHRFPGMVCPPKLAGSNNLIEHMSCAYIYSNKAQAADSAIMEVLGLNGESIKRSRETEDLIQFVMRGAIRRPDFDGSYDVHLYSVDQAKELKRYLIENDITDTNYVAIVPVMEAGIMDVERPVSLRSRAKAELSPLTAKDRAERKKEADKEYSQKRRDKERAEDEKNGIERRKRGRPRNASAPEDCPYPKRRKPRSGGILMSSCDHSSIGIGSTQPVS